MKYLLDTSAIVHYLKFKSVYKRMEKDLSPFGEENIAMVSIVTLGELKSLGLRNDWDGKMQSQLAEILTICSVIPISNDIIELYAEIDAYSKGQHDTLELEDDIILMGKNDLWIAATASVTNAKLITIDKDFSHLADHYLDLVLLSVRGKHLT